MKNDAQVIGTNCSLLTCGLPTSIFLLISGIKNIKVPPRQQVNCSGKANHPLSLHPPPALLTFKTKDALDWEQDTASFSAPQQTENLRWIPTQCVSSKSQPHPSALPHLCCCVTPGIAQSSGCAWKALGSSGGTVTDCVLHPTHWTENLAWPGMQKKMKKPKISKLRYCITAWGKKIHYLFIAQNFGIHQFLACRLRPELLNKQGRV